MNLGKEIANTAILSTAKQLSLLPRIVAEIHRTNAAMPGAKGSDKKERVIADLKIIFDDLIIPVASSVLNLLIELGVAYVQQQAENNEKHN